MQTQVCWWTSIHRKLKTQKNRSQETRAMTVMLEWPLTAIKAPPLALWILLPEIIPPPTASQNYWGSTSCQEVLWKVQCYINRGEITLLTKPMTVLNSRDSSTISWTCHGCFFQPTKKFCNSRSILTKSQLFSVWYINGKIQPLGSLIKTSQFTRQDRLNSLCLKRPLHLSSSNDDATVVTASACCMPSTRQSILHALLHLISKTLCGRYKYISFAEETIV